MMLMYYCTNLTTEELRLLERARVLIVPPLLVIMYDVVIMYDWLANRKGPLDATNYVQDHGQAPRGHLTSNVPVTKSKKQVSWVPRESPPSRSINPPTPIVVGSRNP